MGMTSSVTIQKPERAIREGTDDMITMTSSMKARRPPRANRPGAKRPHTARPRTQLPRRNLALVACLLTFLLLVGTMLVKDADSHSRRRLTRQFTGLPDKGLKDEKTLRELRDAREKERNKELAALGQRARTRASFIKARTRTGFLAPKKGKKKSKKGSSPKAGGSPSSNSGSGNECKSGQRRRLSTMDRLLKEIERAQAV